MTYCGVIEDFAVEGASRYKVREIVDELIGIHKVREIPRAGETRAQRYERLNRRDGDTLPERIG